MEKQIKNTCVYCDRTGKYLEQPTNCKYCGQKLSNRYISMTGKVFIDGKYFGRLGIMDTLIHISKNHFILYLLFQTTLSALAALFTSVLLITLLK